MLYYVAVAVAVLVVVAVIGMHLDNQRAIIRNLESIKLSLMDIKNQGEK